MKYAPETLPDCIFPIVDGNRDWMNKQVVDFVESRSGIATQAERNASGELPGYKSTPVYGLVSLPGTVAEIQHLKAGGKLPNGRESPAWMLVYIDPVTSMAKQELFYFDVAGRRNERAKSLEKLQAKHLRAVEGQIANEPVLSSSMSFAAPPEVGSEDDGMMQLSYPGVMRRRTYK